VIELSGQTDRPFAMMICSARRTPRSARGERYRLLDYSREEGLEEVPKKFSPSRIRFRRADRTPTIGASTATHIHVEDEGVLRRRGRDITYGRPPTGDRRGGNMSAPKSKSGRVRPRQAISESWHGPWCRAVWSKRALTFTPPRRFSVTGRDWDMTTCAESLSLQRQENDHAGQ